MEHSHLPPDVTLTAEAPPRKRRRGLIAALVLLVLIGIGSAAAFQYLNSGGDPDPVVNYEKLDEDEAAAKEQEALEQVAQDQQALKDAQEQMRSVQAEWENARQQAEENDSPETQARLTEAATKREQAKATLKAAEDKLKTADQLREEAEAERDRVEKLLAQEKAHREALLGTWTRPDENGTFRLELREDGTGLMVIDFNATNRFLLGTNQLEVDIEWLIANGDHVIFNSLRGRPEKAFEIVSALKGNHRDEVITHIDENSFTTHSAKKKSKIETWKRISEK